MQSVLLLFSSLLFISNFKVFVQGTCTIDDARVNTVQIIINDTQINTDIYQGTYDGTVISCSASDDIKTAYFNILTTGTHLVLRTTSLFSNFDNDTNKTNVATAALSLKCSFDCQGVKSGIEIKIQVTDTNNHAPEFKNASYEYKVSVPILPGTDFTSYGNNPIIATDIDFSNQDITFTIEPEDFTVTTIRTSDSKNYTAVFASKNILNITGSKSYELTATDAGIPAKSSKVMVNIVYEDLNPDTPLFKKSFYYFTYSVEGDNPTLISNQDDILLFTNKPNQTRVDLSNYSTYFRIALSNGNGSSNIKFDLVLIKPLPEDVPAFIPLTLSATTDQTATTSLIIHIPSYVQFNNNYYTGTYDDISTTVTLDNAITVTSATTPNVSVGEDFKDYLQAQYNEISKSVQILITSSIPITEFRKYSYIAVPIIASVNDNSNKAALILSLTEPIFQFTEYFYNASYTTDNAVKLGSLISLTRFALAVNISISGPYSEYFSIIQEPRKNNYLITVTQILPDDVLKKEKEIILTLIASDSYGNKASSVVILYLPEISKDPPLFSEFVYEATYTPDGITSSITTEKEILINNRDDQSLITITLESYNEYFEVILKENKWTLIVNKPLGQDVLASKAGIILVLTATEENNDFTSQAVVVVNWLPIYIDKPKIRVRTSVEIEL